MTVAEREPGGSVTTTFVGGGGPAGATGCTSNAPTSTVPFTTRSNPTPRSSYSFPVNVATGDGPASIAGDPSSNAIVRTLPVGGGKPHPPLSASVPSFRSDPLNPVVLPPGVHEDNAPVPVPISE